MLWLNDLALRRGPNLLFDKATLTINPGEKVGVCGANGCGKSSLFGLILGTLHADAGDIRLTPGLTIAHVAQEIPASDQAAVEYIIDGDEQLRELEGRLAKAETDGDGHALGELHEQIAAIDGYAARSRAARLMSGLGFANGDEERPLSTFSGGWQMRLNLARALMCRSDLLLLDEPTNHLDLDAVLWLQEWLKGYPGTLLLISHDRDFLDEITGQILFVEQQQLTLYRGNYSAFEQIRAERLTHQQANFEKQQREVAALERFITRFKAKATKAKQAQSRVKALERMERIAPAHVDSPFHFSFADCSRLPSPLLTLEQVVLGYGEKPLLERIELGVQPGERIGLLGHNGAGKSTLLKLLAAEQEPMGGKVERARDLEIGYFAQHQLEQLRPDDSPLLHLQRLDPKRSEQELRDFLGGFDFHGDKALSPVGPFSGGEKSRLVLAMLVFQAPNLLLLDEPTNHLDIEMRHALILALQEYQGGLVVVSHDRHLLRSVCDTLLLVDSGRVAPFDDDLDGYRDWLLGRGSSRQEEAPQERGGGNQKKEQRRLAAEQRKKLQPLKRALTKLEEELDALREEKGKVEQQLADPDIYSDGRREEMKQALQQQGQLEQRIETLEEQWLEQSEELEQMSQDLEQE